MHSASSARGLYAHTRFAAKHLSLSAYSLHTGMPVSMLLLPPTNSAGATTGLALRRTAYWGSFCSRWLFCGSPTRGGQDARAPSPAPLCCGGGCLPADARTTTWAASACRGRELRCGPTWTPYYAVDAWTTAVAEWFAERDYPGWFWWVRAGVTTCVTWIFCVGLLPATTLRACRHYVWFCLHLRCRLTYGALNHAQLQLLGRRRVSALLRFAFRFFYAPARTLAAAPVPG